MISQEIDCAPIRPNSVGIALPPGTNKTFCSFPSPLLSNPTHPILADNKDPMTGNEAPSTRVFAIPELAEAVFQFAGPRTIRTLRLVCRLFPDRCSLFFFVTLDLANPKRYPDLKRIADSATDSSAPEDGWGILDHIHSIKLNGRVQYVAVSSTPLARVLNRCRNIRHINIVDPRERFGGTRSAPSEPLPLWPDLSDLAALD